MLHSFLSFIQSPPGIISIILIFLLLSPLYKVLFWKLFSFDSKVQALLHQKKSSEVRTGKILETISPLLEQFPVDIQKEGTSTVYIGQPIDYIHFDPDEGITFIEIKSANAKLTGNQKKIIEHIEKGNIFWADVKIKGDK